MASKYAYQLIPEEYFFENFAQKGDLGEQIRKQVKKFMNPVTKTPLVYKELNDQLDALERLANNTHCKSYPRLHSSTATGLSAEQCNKVLSSEFLKYLQDENTTKSKKE